MKKAAVCFNESVQTEEKKKEAETNEQRRLSRRLSSAVNRFSHGTVIIVMDVENSEVIIDFDTIEP